MTTEIAGVSSRQPSAWYGVAGDLGVAGLERRHFSQQSLHSAIRPPWHDQDVSCGLGRRLMWVGAAASDSGTQDILVPALPKGEAVVLSKDDKTFGWYGIRAKPDYVLGHRGNLLVVEFKSHNSDAKGLNPDNWRWKVTPKECLQVLISGLCVAQQTGRWTACLLRYPAAAVLVTATAEVLNDIAETVGPARSLLKVPEEKDLDASTMAKLAAIRLERHRLIRWPKTDASRIGDAAHLRLAARVAKPR